MSWTARAWSPSPRRTSALHSRARTRTRRSSARFLVTHAPSSPARKGRLAMEEATRVQPFASSGRPAQRARDRSRAVEPDLLQYCPELADDDPQRGLPSPGRLPVPQLVGQFVAMDRPLMLGGEVCEHQPALSAGQAPLGDEAVVALDAHLAGQVDPKRPQRPSNDAPTAAA